MSTHLTVADIAHDMHVSKMTVHRWIQRGHLPAIRVGRVIRIERAAYELWKKDHS